MTVGLDRNEIVRRFEALLDSALASEEPPAGLDPAVLNAVIEGRDAQSPDERCDSYALWAAVTALTQEIKLQGRAFQELSGTLPAQIDKVSSELRAVYADRERQLQREAERRCRREILGSMIDLRDRLGRGHESARSGLAAAAAAAASAPKPGWWSRLLMRGQQPVGGDHGEILAALVRGYELSIERLDQTLSDFNVREIRCEGESFDPKRMNAVESEETAAAPPGTVMEVYRSGYEWNGEVFRPAQVRVSRAPAASDGAQQQ